MSRGITPGSFHDDSGGTYRQQTYFRSDLLRRHGLKAILAIIVAALFAFAPLTLLYWFNELRCRSVAIVEPGQNVLVKPGRYQEDQQRDEPGETALLKIVCDVPVFAGFRELLCDEDPARRDPQFTDSTYVRRELVFLRRTGFSQLPFGLLGKPPVSVWLPAGDYEILVVHESPNGLLDTETRSYSYPWVSVIADCSLEARRTTTCRVSLPHYNWGGAASIQMVGSGVSAPEELAALLEACETITPIPTPSGYLLALGEPTIQHSDEHRNCQAQMQTLHTLPREWTRDQLAALRNWLPPHAQVAQAKLSQLVDRLMWREWLEGWYCYAAAAVSGLVFTRWGTIALLEPWRRGDSWRESVALLAKIAFASAAAWLLFQILTDSSGCHGPVQFRIH